MQLRDKTHLCSLRGPGTTEMEAGKTIALAKSSPWGLEDLQLTTVWNVRPLLGGELGRV